MLLRGEYDDPISQWKDDQWSKTALGDTVQLNAQVFLLVPDLSGDSFVHVYVPKVSIHGSVQATL